MKNTEKKTKQTSDNTCIMNANHCYDDVRFFYLFIHLFYTPIKIPTNPGRLNWSLFLSIDI